MKPYFGKNKIIVSLVVVIVALAAYSAVSMKKAEAPAPGTISPVKDMKLAIGETIIPVEVAWTTEELYRGLSGRQSLPENQGLYFIFPFPYQIGIWMKDMKFPIDIIWIDSNNKITTIKENVLPDTYPQVFKSEGKTRFVLEVNDGFVKSHGIKVGDEVRIVTP